MNMKKLLLSKEMDDVKARLYMVPASNHSKVSLGFTLLEILHIRFLFLFLFY